MKKSCLLIDTFNKMEDHRVNRTKLHSLENIIFISMAAVISGAETWNEIQDYGENKIEWLKNFLDLENGIPSHDTFNRFYSNLDPEKFESCFRKWIGLIVGTINEDIISIDGKTIRGNRTIHQSPLHVVSAWSHNHRLSLGQLKTHDKSNEITIIPELLESLLIDDCTVTIDAMGCQYDIADKILAKNANYILAVKKNHPEFYRTIQDSFRFIRPDSVDVSEDFGHGRIEKRVCSVITDLNMLESKSPWNGLKSIIRIESERIIKATGEIQPSIRYYITNLTLDAVKASEYIRAHWGVENNLHWMLDVAFSEDNCKKRNQNAEMNFSLIRKIALMVLEKDKHTNLGVKSRRKKAAQNNEYLLGLLKID